MSRGILQLLISAYRCPSEPIVAGNCPAGLHREGAERVRHEREQSERFPGACLRITSGSRTIRALMARSAFIRRLSISASRGSALLLYDLHLFLVHTTAMHLELR